MDKVLKILERREKVYFKITLILGAVMFIMGVIAISGLYENWICGFLSIILFLIFITVNEGISDNIARYKKEKEEKEFKDKILDFIKQGKGEKKK